MSDSDSDYNVESYIKPTVKRSTYDNDDNLSNEEESSDLEKSGESEEEVIDIREGMKEESQCVLPKELPIENKKKKQKIVEEPIRTNNRFILYVSNLSQDTTRTMLEAFFSDCGTLKSVRIPKKRLSRFAFVEMKDLEGYKNGLKFDGKELDGARIKVQQGSKNKKHITNKSRMQKKKRIQIYENKLKNRIKKNDP